jgi:hypothetical protein
MGAEGHLHQPQLSHGVATRGAAFGQVGPASSVASEQTRTGGKLTVRR